MLKSGLDLNISLQFLFPAGKCSSFRFGSFGHEHLNSSLLPAEASLLSFPASATHNYLKPCPVDLRREDEAAPFPLSSFPFPSDGEKTLCDPSFAHSYQLARKMDLDISKVCASKYVLQRLSFCLPAFDLYLCSF